MIAGAPGGVGRTSASGRAGGPAALLAEALQELGGLAEAGQGEQVRRRGGRDGGSAGIVG